MNKEQFVIILQSALFYFDGATKEEIMSYNIYPEQLIDVGIKLSQYLNAIKIKQ